MHRSVYRRPMIERNKEVKDRIREIAMKRKRYGYRRITDEIRKTEIHNHKKIYRLYTEMDLKFRRKSRKKRLSGLRVSMILPAGPNERWSMDFVSDRLYRDRTFRVFNLLDDCSREAVLQHVDFSISGRRLVRLFDDLLKTRSLPRQIVCDNGPEFTSKALRKWAKDKGVTLAFIEKGKPTQNAFVESFNGKFRDECLNEEWFMNLADARIKIERWRIDYNTNRPHSGLKGLSPYDFIARTA